MYKDEDKLLVRIAEMYYQEDKNQSQISKELNIHRSTISRLLKRSREEGIVTISINYDKAGTYDLEKQLKERFGLEKAIIVQAAPEMNRTQKDKLLASGVGDYLAEILEDEMIIGFSWGETMAAIPEGLGTYTVSNITCIPMIGGPSGRLISDFHVNTITYEASKKLNGRALLIDSPAFPDTVSLKKALMENEFNQELIDYWRKLDIAILGIGSPTLQASESWKQFYGEDVLAYLEGKKVIGDVVSRFFNLEGQHIDNELDDRLIGIDISDLKRTPYRIGIAAMVDKAEAIASALKGGYINVLVTTEETAIEVLKR
ncbi:Cro/Cl family transcriptional regulator [Enterococcus florum]|uniref:Cro/Cl family transcriptional regulator n=1 Tax=Enterococcus florum TaxID=2480627 RepID=A0A4P5PCM2_9ENTE|nr:sugar-binding transcriptional regulator [Enterococcus florum]GCF94264.1 Cro/Cl family transcriptional regulator [Enterococcus florum]